MRQLLKLSTIFILFLLFICTNKSYAFEFRNFNSRWKFCKDSLIGAERVDYNDFTWRTLDLPHDWSIEDLSNNQSQEQIGPYSKLSPGSWLTGYSMGGNAWYRKEFVLEKRDKDKTFKILFDGIMIESDIWINGNYLGFHPNGYTPFSYDLTPYLNPIGKKNIIAVKVKNIGRNHRWYSGSGIYRDVKLLVSNTLHIDLWGVHVTTAKASQQESKVDIQIKLVNTGNVSKQVELRAKLIESNNKLVAQSIGSQSVQANESIETPQSLIVRNAKLWSPEHPYLYNLVIDVISNGKIIDNYKIKIGIRSLKWNAQNGLAINGESIKLRGANIHHDNGILGAAAFSNAEERKVKILKQNGFNAVRTSHNPPSARFLEICDSLGVLVLEETFDTWEKAKVKNDYAQYFKDYWRKDLESMLLRDRNHPSVIMWSIGNEIIERADPRGLEITKELVDYVKLYDKERPITEAIQGFSGIFGGGHTSWDDSAPAYTMLDIAGYNYGWREWESDHQKYPERIMVTTESSSIDMSRINDQIEKCPWLIGDFVWTGMEYIGESGCGAGYYEKENVNYGTYIPARKKGYGRGWPWHTSWCGDIDLIGNKKARMYYRDVVWHKSLLEMAVHEPTKSGNKEVIGDQGWPTEFQSWTWPENIGDTLEVAVYTRCDSVTLELNGRKIGTQKITNDFSKNNSSTFATEQSISQYVTRFTIPYISGEIKASGYSKGTVVVSKLLKTIGKATKIRLTTENNSIAANRDNLAFISVEIVDEVGNNVLNTDKKINFDIEGGGELMAVGNGNPAQMYSHKQPACNTFNGKALLVVRPFSKKGRITVKANCDGLISDKLIIKTR